MKLNTNQKSVLLLAAISFVGLFVAHANVFSIEAIIWRAIQRPRQPGRVAHRFNCDYHPNMVCEFAKTNEHADCIRASYV
jgi:hypothetical protein